MSNVRRSKDNRTIGSLIDPEVLSDIRKIEKDIIECANYLSVAWNRENYNSYEKAVNHYFKYILAVESAYDIIVIIDSRKVYNNRAQYYVYTYQANQGKPGFNNI